MAPTPVTEYKEIGSFFVEEVQIQEQENREREKIKLLLGETFEHIQMMFAPSYRLPIWDNCIFFPFGLGSGARLMKMSGERERIVPRPIDSEMMDVNLCIDIARLVMMLGKWEMNVPSPIGSRLKENSSGFVMGSLSPDGTSERELVFNEVLNSSDYFEGERIATDTKRSRIARTAIKITTKYNSAILASVDRFRFIPFVTRLLELCCWFILASGRKNVLRILWVRLKYPFGKASILISWQCGGMERYPDHRRLALSDIARYFCKKMISRLVIRYWEHKEGRKLTQADYKKLPEGWAQNVWYGDPSRCTNKARDSMLKGLCKVQEIPIPREWSDIIETYERFMEKKSRKSDTAHYAAKLKSWLWQKRAEENVNHLFDRFPEHSNEERNYIIRCLVERLTPYVPEVSTISLVQSGELEEETVISKDKTSSGHVSDCDPSETNTVKANLQKRHTINKSEENTQMKTVTQSPHFSGIPMSSLDETGTSNPETTMLAGSLYDISDSFKDPLGGNASFFTEYPRAASHNDWSDNEVSKRKTQDASLDQTPPTSKRQKCWTEPELLQSSQITAALNDSADSIPEDLKGIIPYNMNVFG